MGARWGLCVFRHDVGLECVREASSGRGPADVGEV